MKSEGKYTASLKATNTVVDEAQVSAKAGKLGITVGHTTEDTLHYDHLTDKTPSGFPEHTEHPFVEVNGPAGSTASSGSFTIEVNVCLGFCLGIGIGVQ